MTHMEIIKRLERAVAMVQDPMDVTFTDVAVLQAAAAEVIAALRAEQQPGEQQATEGVATCAHCDWYQRYPFADQAATLAAAQAMTAHAAQCQHNPLVADLATLRAEHAKCWKLPPPDTDPVLEEALSDAVRLRAGIAALEQDITTHCEQLAELALFHEVSTVEAGGITHEAGALLKVKAKLAALRDGRG